MAQIIYSAPKSIEGNTLKKHYGIKNCEPEQGIRLMIFWFIDLQNDLFF